MGTVSQFYAPPSATATAAVANGAVHYSHFMHQNPPQFDERDQTGFRFLILRYLSLQLALGGGSCPSGSRDTRNNMPQLRLETDEHILVEDERGMEKWGLIKKSRFINSSPRRRWIIAEPVPNGHSFLLQPDEEEDHQPPIFDAPMVCCQIECNLSGQAFSVQSI